MFFIEPAQTPNPNALKFQIQGESSKIYQDLINSDSGFRKELTKDLLDMREVTDVFFGSDFVSVNKISEANWHEMQSEIISTLIELLDKHSQISASNDSAEKQCSYDEKDPIIVQIKAVIDEKIRPMVEGDGGGIDLISFKNGVVVIELSGACSGCPYSTLTLKDGIERTLNYYVPEVREVKHLSEV